MDTQNQSAELTPHPFNNVKKEWEKEDEFYITLLEDELVYLMKRLECHCFNPKMYKILHSIIEMLAKDIENEKGLYASNYGKTYIRPLIRA